MKYRVLLSLLLVTNMYAGVITYSIYTECNKQDMATFVLDCIKNANPKSDEEPEDWIYMCKDMSKDMFCTYSTGARYWESRVFSPNISCDCTNCTDIIAIQQCKARGFNNGSKDK